RHTRFSRDWSSDVCSSDLPGMAHGYLFFDFALLMFATDRLYSTGNKKYFYLLGLASGLIAITRVSGLVVMLIPLLWGLNNMPARSEERRVGKECRERRSSY